MTNNFISVFKKKKVYAFISLGVIFIALLVGVVAKFQNNNASAPSDVENMVKDAAIDSFSKPDGVKFSDTELQKLIDERFDKAKNYKNEDPVAERLYKFDQYYAVYDVLVAQYYAKGKDPKIKSAVEELRKFLQDQYPEDYQSFDQSIWQLK